MIERRIAMGKEWISKKDPRWICERTISYGTMEYATLKRPNPEYVGLTLEQAKAREELKKYKKIKPKTKKAQEHLEKTIEMLEWKAGLKKVKKEIGPENKKQNIIEGIILLVIISVCVAIPFVLFKKIEDWWNAPYDSSKKSAELTKEESECRAKGMYPYRSGCDKDINDPYCYVVCMPYPQKK